MLILFRHPCITALLRNSTHSSTTSTWGKKLFVCFLVVNKKKKKLEILRLWWRFCLQHLRQQWWGASPSPSLLKDTDKGALVVPEKNAGLSGSPGLGGHWGGVELGKMQREEIQLKNLQTSCKTSAPQPASRYHSTDLTTGGHWPPPAGQTFAKRSLHDASEGGYLVTW